MSIKNVWSVWQSRKLTHEVAIRDAIKSRTGGADRFVQFVRWVMEQESETAMQETIRKVLLRMELSQRPFRDHPLIDKWWSQFSEPEKLRFRSLLLRGLSCSGKTRKAVSIFGALHAFVVNCQGLGDKLPSLRGFDRELHHGIVFDEISTAQVLANKLVFQSGPEMVSLGQSACSQFAYKRWFFATPMILCSNTMATSRMDDPDMSFEDEQWLKANVEDVRLEGDQVWYEKDE